RDLQHTRKKRSSAREHDAGVQLLETGTSHFFVNQGEDLLGTRLEDLCHDLAREHARLTAPDRGYLDRLVTLDQRRQRAPVFLLEALGVRNRGPQADGEIVREVV